ncbi:thioredoxin domain-containing protein [Pseudonocardia sp. KRD291]|uniref:DsbA family protein n=1 Tax=Pseudonocardia sp. KRD291 TaxID=2792007 RepID=UPI001C4A00CB|nr:thioredoxin domain-containing protein [Pseudonocardia sp. KRD291]MBW0101993.1 thioredoxin domain-containing protein [Pseudonocardia sp. KRD291]
MSSRSERERREAAQARLSAAGITPTKAKGGGGGGRQGLVIAAVILVVAVVAGLFVYFSQPSSTGDAAAVAPTYTAARTGTVVMAGAPTAPVTVDVYEDYLCPACQQFERIYGDEITTALNQGKVKVNYHGIAILDRASEPQGYSTLAGSAALCAADAGIWPAFHSRLFAEQPAEGGPGKTAQELAAIGQQMGAQGDFAGCVNANADAAAIAQATNDAAGNEAVAPGGSFGTPTVLLNGTKIEINDQDWLSRAIGA